MTAFRIPATIAAGACALLLTPAADLPSLVQIGTAPEAVAQEPAGRADTLALTNVTLIDGTGAPPRPRMTVLVHGDRIGGVFPVDEAPIPSSAEVLDLRGRYLIPGLINTHVHLPMIAWARDSVSTGLERMLHAGVTTVREMAGDTRLSAELSRARLVEGASIPTIHYAVRMAGPTFYEPVRDTNRAWIGYPAGTAPWAQAVTAETDMARAVALAAGTGATGLKLYTDLDDDVVRRLVAEAHRQGLEAWAHGTLFPAGPLEAVRAGLDGLSHICFLFFGLQPEVAASMADRVPFDPGLVDLEGGPFQELMQEMRAREVVLDATARNASQNPGAHSFGCTPELLDRSLGAAHRAGVRISTGTDYVLSEGDPDSTLFTEIEYLVDAGVLSPLEAITAATLNGAHAIGIEDRYGTIEVGKVADLVVLSGDPAEDIDALRSVVAVFKDGRQVSRGGPSDHGIEPLSEDSQPTPIVEPNDQRDPAGHMIDGELRIRLEGVEAAWYPRGPTGPRIMIPAFAEAGRPPQVPGPLIRAAAGTPVHVTIHNTLDRPIVVRGLLDRASMPVVPAAAATGLPAFAFSEPVVVPPGEERETRFTPTEPVSSFYYAHAVPPGSDGSAFPFGALEEGAFMGALVVDPAQEEPPPDERVLMMTRWGSPAEPGMGISWKMMLNGRSWPFTERLEYSVGDSVRWRVINASAVDHPMHLHGFYFTVDGVGDTQADFTHPPPARPLAVTQRMEEFSSLRLTWVPEEPGNWLFHCHLVRHMGELQRFQMEREAPGHAGNGHEMEGMAGLVTGITIHPAPGHEAREEVAARRLDLWTGERPGVYGGEPELGFVVQEGVAVPAPDSTRVPGSPIVLTRGEPTEIMVHNRLDFPLSVHWHGLELPSLYDGVGGWSGDPGGTRPPIAPGDSVRVFITPPRAGTFMYHTHGEPGHELSQGLYGPFLVLEPDEEPDPGADRTFLLAARGAERDAVPAINGMAWPAPERFEIGRTYRLRFLHISPDAFKRVRLLENGEPVRWRPIAKDGADLPEEARQIEPAILGIGVGETYDVEWTPEARGVHVLEVTTEFYPSIGGSVTQRIAFGVGDIDEADLALPPAVDRPIVEVSAEERARYTGTFLGRPPGAETDPVELILDVWEEGERLYSTGVQFRGEEAESPRQALFPLGEHAFESGRDLEGLIHLMQPRYRFSGNEDVFDRLELEFEGGFTLMFERLAAEIEADDLRRGR